MPTYVFTAPDGREYEIEGPEGSTVTEAFAVLQQQIGAQSGPQPQGVLSSTNGPNGLPAITPDNPFGLYLGDQDVVPENGRSTARIARDFAGGVVAGIPQAVGAVAGIGSMIPGVHYVADPIRRGANYVADEARDLLVSDYQIAKGEEMQRAIEGALSQVEPLPEGASTSEQIDHFINQIAAQGGAAAEFLYDNPTQVLQVVAETLPSMFAGGLVGKGLGVVAKTARPITLAAAGEGAVAAGAVAGEIAESNRAAGVEGYTPDRLLGVPAGVATAGIGRLGGALNPTDPDALIGRMVGAGQRNLIEGARKEAAERAAGLPRRVITGAATETAEEAVQSGQERVFTNLGTGEDIGSGVGGDIVLGAAAGGALGGAAAIRRPRVSSPVDDFDATLAAENAALEQQQTEQEQQPVAAEDRAQDSLRRKHAGTFLDFDSYQAAAQDDLVTRSLTDGTEENAAFSDWLAGQDVKKRYPRTEADQRKTAQEFIEEMSDDDTLGALEQDYVRELTEHAEYKEAEAALSPEEAAKRASVRSAYLNAYKQAQETNDEDAKTRLEDLVASGGLMPGEWREVKNQVLGRYKPAKAPAAKASAATATATQPQAPAAPAEAAAVTPAAPAEATSMLPAFRPNTNGSKLVSRLNDIAKAEGLPDNWSTLPEFADTVNDVAIGKKRGNVGKAGKDGLTKAERQLYADLEKYNESRRPPQPEIDPQLADAPEDPIAKFTAAVRRLPKPKTPEPKARNRQERAIIDDLRQQIGPEWDKIYPKVVDAMKAGKVSLARRLADAAIEDSVEDKKTTGGVGNILSRLISSPEFRDTLTAKQQGVFDAVMEAARGNRAEDLINPDGSLNASRIGEIAGGRDRSSVNKALRRDVPDKIAKFLNISESDVAAVLAAVARRRKDDTSRGDPGIAAQLAAQEDATEAELRGDEDPDEAYAKMSDAEKAAVDEAAKKAKAETDKEDLRRDIDQINQSDSDDEMVTAAEATGGLFNPAAGFGSVSPGGSQSEGAGRKGLGVEDVRETWIKYAVDKEGMSRADAEKAVDEKMLELKAEKDEDTEAADQKLAEEQAKAWVNALREYLQENAGQIAAAWDIAKTEEGPDFFDLSEEAQLSWAQSVFGWSQDEDSRALVKDALEIETEYLEYGKVVERTETGGGAADSAGQSRPQDGTAPGEDGTSRDTTNAAADADSVGSDGSGGVATPPPRVEVRRPRRSENRDVTTLRPRAALRDDSSKPKSKLVLKKREYSAVSEESDPRLREFDNAADAMQHIVETGNEIESSLAERLLEYSRDRDIKVRVVDGDFQILDAEAGDPKTAARLRAAFRSGRFPAGVYLGDGVSDVIYLSDSGTNNRTLLHEVLHAATSLVLADVDDGRTSDPRALALHERASKVMNAVRNHAASTSVEDMADLLYGDDWDADGIRDTAIMSVQGIKQLMADEAGTDVSEFVAYGMTEPLMQVYLDQLMLRREASEQPQSAFRRFINAVRDFFLTSAPEGAATAFDELVVVTDQLIDYQSEGIPTTGDTVLRYSRGGPGVLARVDRTRKGNVTVRQGAARDYILDKFGRDASQAWDNAVSVLRHPVRNLEFLHQIVRRVESELPSARKWYNALNQFLMIASEVRERAERIAVAAKDLAPQRLALVNDYIGASTFYQKWGYDPLAESGPDDLAVWQKKYPDKKAVKIDGTMRTKYDRLAPAERKIVRDVFTHGERMRQRKLKIAADLEIDGKYFAPDGLDGPYAPLKRFGDYAVVLKSQAYRDAVQALEKSASKANKRKLENLESDTKHYLVQYFNTEAAANRFAEENGGAYASVESFPRDQNYEQKRAPTTTILENVLAKLSASDIDAKSKQALSGIISETYVAALDERDARSSGILRRNRAGYEKDMIRSFLAHSNSEATLLATMEHGRDINLQLVEMGLEAAKDRNRLMSSVQLLREHYALTLDNPRTPIQDRITAINSVMMLTSNVTYFVQNAMQPLISVTKMAADFQKSGADVSTYGNTWSSLFKGYAVARRAIDSSFLKQLGTAVTMGAVDLDNKFELNLDNVPAKFQPLLREMQLRQLADVGMQEDLGQFTRWDTGWTGLNEGLSWFAGVTHRLYQIARYVEAYNRIASGVAAYEMASKHPGTTKKFGMTPTEYAISVVEDTQGNFSRQDAPLAIKKLPKVVTQYRKFQLMMAWMYGNAVKDTFRGQDAHTRAVARRTLGLSLFHTGMVAGVGGWPAVSMVAPLFLAWSGEGDEPEDLERWIRDKVDDQGLATLLTRGVPAFAGVDMSQKLGHEYIFSLAPYADLSPTVDGVKDLWWSLALGPTGGTVANAARGVEAMQRGETLKGLELMVPRGIRQWLESYRYATEGYSLTNRNIILDPREIDIGSLATNALGLPSTEINHLKWTRGQQYEIEEWAKRESGRIRREYVEAYRSGDKSAKRAAVKEFRALQDAKDRLRPFFNDARASIKRQPVADLLRAPRDRRRIERNTQAAFGVR